MAVTKGVWGGKRKGAGHPKNPYPLRLIKIACTEEEYQAILKLGTRERAEKLLEIIEVSNEGK